MFNYQLEGWIMYEVTDRERELLKSVHGFTDIEIDTFDAYSDKVRKGESISGFMAFGVCHFQEQLQKIRKQNKRWWQFWK